MQSFDELSIECVKASAETFSILTTNVKIFEFSVLTHLVPPRTHNHTEYDHQESDPSLSPAPRSPLCRLSPSSSLKQQFYEKWKHEHLWEGKMKWFRVFEQLADIFYLSSLDIPPPYISVSYHHYSCRLLENKFNFVLTRD